MKFYRTALALTLCSGMLLLSAAPAQAGTVLMGQVRPDYLPDLLTWNVEVSAVAEGVGTLSGSPRLCAGDIYYFEVDSNLVVNFILARPHYRSKRVPSINVTTALGNPYRIQPNVVLRRIRTRARASLMSKPESPTGVVSHHAPQNANSDALRAELRAELEEQAELARLSKTVDIFQFNLEVYGDVYRNEPQYLKNAIVEFKADPKFTDVSKAPEGRAELYQKMIQRDRGESVTIPSESLFGLANDSSVSPSIRMESVRTMTLSDELGLGTSDPNTHTLEFLRENAQKPSSVLYLPSLIQLIKIGKKEDKDRIVKDLSDSISVNPARANTVITAIEAARWAEGNSVLSTLAARNDVSPLLRDFAAEAASRMTGVNLNSATSVINQDSSVSALIKQMWSERIGARKQTNRTSSQRVALGEGTEGVVQMTSGTNDLTEITLKLQYSQSSNEVKNYVLWAIDPDAQVVRLGQAVSGPNRRQAQVRTETSLKNFRLFITAEKSDTVSQPAGPVVATIKSPS